MDEKKIPQPYKLVLGERVIEPQIMVMKTRRGAQKVVCHFQITEDEPIPMKSFSLSFLNPEHLLRFFHPILKKAAELWPDDPYIKYYREEEE